MELSGTREPTSVRRAYNLDTEEAVTICHTTARLPTQNLRPETGDPAGAGGVSPSAGPEQAAKLGEVTSRPVLAGDRPRPRQGSLGNEVPT